MMDQKNLDKLTTFLNLAINGHPMAYDITNPTYVKFYYDIFKNEAKNSKHGPLLSETFIDKIIPKLSNTPKTETIISNFCLNWDAWIRFYREVQKTNEDTL